MTCPEMPSAPFGTPQGPRANPGPTSTGHPASGTRRLDLTDLDGIVQHYMHRGLAKSMHSSGLKRYLRFCQEYSVSQQFHISERLLCSFVAVLARQGLAPGMIRMYLAAVRQAQIVQGHPEPREQSSMLCLNLMQTGVCRDRAQSGLPPSRVHLPITPPILRRMQESWR